jgi:hypothetical protein
LTACLALLTVLLQVDATGDDGFIAGAHNDPFNNFFQVHLVFSCNGSGTNNKHLKSSQQSLPSASASPSFHLPPLLSARRLWNVVSRHRQLPEKSIPKEHFKSGLFSRRARLKSLLEHVAIKPNEPVPEGKVREGDEKQRETFDDVSAVLTLAHCYLNITAVSMIPRMTR